MTAPLIDRPHLHGFLEIILKNTSDGEKGCK